MSEQTRRRFAETVRAEPVDLALACLLLAAEADPDVDVDEALAELDRLATAVPRPEPGDPRRQAAALRVALASFAGGGEDYLRLESSLLHEVLRHRRGLPILLSVVWLEVARRAGIAAYGVGLPGHFVVAVGRPGDAVLVDAFAGGRALSDDDVVSLVHDAGATLRPDHLAPWATPDILLRILTNIRAWAASDPMRARTRLWAVQLSLLLPRHPVDLRREHGEQLVRLGQFAAGAAELGTYADAVGPADGRAADAARRAARLARARLN